jgi:hypothetical protein
MRSAASVQLPLDSAVLVSMSSLYSRETSLRRRRLRARVQAGAEQGNGATGRQSFDMEESLMFFGFEIGGGYGS